ncbi:hypothetical protein [Amycolatopsis sp. CA-126428]|uniref:hypothetical protein n=1 Tax=Amycolatopsis sp. CA-126428 TaxID=2073158 RepID=UPI003F8D5784
MSDTYLPSRLDQALFGAPFIVIDADNNAHTIAYRLDDAVETLNTDGAARAIVGTLEPAFLAIDIDPGDTDAGDDAGEAVAEQLLLWADRYGLPWLRRASGRPGHTHLVIKTPPSLREELLRTVRTIATRQTVSATVRSTLRLTSSPHRHALPSPVMSCTLTTTDIPAPVTSGAPRATRPARRRESSKRSRSEDEYGHALALARAGYTTAQAWAFANLTGTKAREIGKKAWRRWFWAPATTIAAAEGGLTEQQAWHLFRQASPTQAAHVGRDTWRRIRWLPALREAAESRPRRRRLGTPRAGDRQNEPSPRQLRHVRAVLHAAVDKHLARGTSAAVRTGTIIGVRISSLRAVLDAFAHAVLATRGSISIRHWAERAGLDPKTVRRARDAALKLGILKRVHRYTGGETDCDAFVMREDAAAAPDRELTSPTLYTPTHGQADTLRLRTQHQRDRNQFALNRNLRVTTPEIGYQHPKEEPSLADRIDAAHHRQRELTGVDRPHFRDCDFFHNVDCLRGYRDTPSRSNRRESPFIYSAVDGHGRNAQQRCRLANSQETRCARSRIGHHKPPVLHGKGEAGDDGPGDRPTSTPLASASARNINSSTGPTTAANRHVSLAHQATSKFCTEVTDNRAGLMLGASRNMTSS